jgi:hypothetical protein
VEKPGEKRHSEDLDIDGRAIMRWISRSGMRGTEWIDMNQDRDR